MAISEQVHWYDAEGNPRHTIIGKNGKERNVTLRDARQYHYVPSVTTILGVAAKPGLENWKIDQALMSALTLPMGEDEPLHDFMARAKEDAKQQAIQAAERGTQIHADVERGFAEGIESVAYSAVRESLKALYPAHLWVAEDSFYASNGYGGKVDLYSRDGVVVDFKTKDGLEGKNPAKLVYDEHGMQLSAYANGLGFRNPDRLSVFIDREQPDIVLVHQWDAESHKRHLSMFMALLSYWKLSKNYFPEVEQ